YANAKAGNLSDADITDACEAFKNARREWERSEAFLYGAAANNEIDPHIDSWPLDHDQMVKALNKQDIIAGIKGENPAQFIYTKHEHFESVIGFHGLEFVLFRNGAARTAAMLNANETEAGMTSVKGIDELAFAAAVAGDIYNMTSLLQYGWNGDATLGSWLTSNCNWVVEGLKGLENSAGALSSAGIGYGQFLLNATGDKAWFPTWQETLENVFVGGCSNICQEVYTQKLGQAYRVATGHGGTTEDGKKESRDYIESPYSKRSFIDYQDNIYSIKNSLYGTRDVTATTPVANSLMTIMKKYNYSGYNTLSTALDEAIASLETAKKSGIAFVDDPAHAQVKTCIDKINTLDEELNKAGAWFRALKVSK
ncbi:MAG: imelysin, partial [Prevotella sp.]|nr:imelysin [Prevotella sp.]